MFGDCGPGGAGIRCKGLCWECTCCVHAWATAMGPGGLSRGSRSQRALEATARPRLLLCETGEPPENWTQRRVRERLSVFRDPAGSCVDSGHR